MKRIYCVLSIYLRVKFNLFKVWLNFFAYKQKKDKNQSHTTLNTTGTTSILENSGMNSTLGTETETGDDGTENDDSGSSDNDTICNSDEDTINDYVLPKKKPSLIDTSKFLSAMSINQAYIFYD